MTTRMTGQRLARLIADGDVEAVRTAVTDAPRLLDRTVERAGQGGWTPLHVAVAEGQEEIVRLLVKAGADLSATTEHGRSYSIHSWQSGADAAEPPMPRLLQTIGSAARP